MSDIQTAFEEWIEASGVDYDSTLGDDGEFIDHNAADAFDGFEANWHLIESLRAELTAQQTAAVALLSDRVRVTWTPDGYWLDRMLVGPAWADVLAAEVEKTSS